MRGLMHISIALMIAHMSAKFCLIFVPPQGISANIRISLISPEESLAYILPLIVWVYLYSNFCGWLRKTHLLCNRMPSAVQGHPRSLILTPIERACATSYWLLIVTLVLSCTVSEIRQAIGWKLQIFPTPLSFNALARRDKLFIAKTRIVEDFMIACVVLTQC